MYICLKEVIPSSLCNTLSHLGSRHQVDRGLYDVGHDPDVKRNGSTRLPEVWSAFEAQQGWPPIPALLGPPRSRDTVKRTRPTIQRTPLYPLRSDLPSQSCPPGRVTFLGDHPEVDTRSQHAWAAAAANTQVVQACPPSPSAAKREGPPAVRQTR